MKKHIEDLRNALYKHDLTVAAKEDTPPSPPYGRLRTLISRCR